MEIHMSTLQIRQVPEPLYELLGQQAALAHRSITQQAIVVLSQALTGDAKPKRLAALQKIRAMHATTPSLALQDKPIDAIALETWLREDRDR
jgi:plasmid stability protein